MANRKNRKFKNEIEIIPDEMDENENKREQKSLSLQDKKSICVLTFLYVLQGIPLGLAGSVPLILQSKGVSYSAQATFSLVFWPFSMKILWAPIVDALYWSRMGRRRTWLVPAQYLIGLAMLHVSRNAPHWLQSTAGAAGATGAAGAAGAASPLDIWPLTAAFFLLNFLAATQDIAVDGWALTMLSRNSVGWASTCNSVGQTVGYFIAFIVFLALESPQFCNDWIRSTPQPNGLITFEGFLYFWGLVFIATTTLVMIFQTEEPSEECNKCVNVSSRGDNSKRDNKEIESIEANLSVWKTYETLWRIMKLRPIITYVVTLILIKIGFSAMDSITGLKLIEKGVSKEKMAFIGSLIVPVQILLAILVSKHTTGSQPLNVFINLSIPRLMYGPIFILLVYLTPMFQQSDGSYSYNYYLVLTIIYSSHQIFVYPMFVSLMAFYARISDPAIGGTYMTLLNTVTNLASNIPNTIMLYLIDYLTTKQCVGGPHDGQTCLAKSNLSNCLNSNPKGVCETKFDGYYLEVIVCTLIGFITVIFRRRSLYHVQNLPLEAWRIFRK